MSGVLEVVRIAGLATIQDGGRPGRMHEGIPPGGALVPELLARANRAASVSGVGRPTYDASNPRHSRWNSPPRTIVPTAAVSSSSAGISVSET